MFVYNYFFQEGKTMTFPNAFNGVKKLFTSEILKLIAAVCAIVAAVAGIIALAGVEADAVVAGVGGGIATVIFGVASAVLLLIAYILKLVGLKKAGNDEPKFQQAFLLAIFALILSVVASILSSLNVGNGVVDDIVSIFAAIADILIVVFVIQGIQNLAEKLNQNGMAETGRKLLIIILVFYILAIIATLVVIIFGANVATGVIAGILAVVAQVLKMVGYIVFLVYLGKAKNMLAAK